MSKRSIKRAERFLALALVLAMAAGMVWFMPRGFANTVEPGTATLEIRVEISGVNSGFSSLLYSFKVGQLIDSVYGDTPLNAGGIKIEIKTDSTPGDTGWSDYSDASFWSSFGGSPVDNTMSGEVQLPPFCTVRISGLEPGEYIVDRYDYNLGNTTGGQIGHDWDDDFELSGGFCPSAAAGSVSFGGSTASNVELTDGEITRVCFHNDAIHKVYFALYSGGSPDWDVFVSHGDPVDEPDPPTRQGYRFIRWMLGDNEFFFDEPVTEDIMLTAEWEIEQYTITYDLEGGENYAGNPTSYTMEETVTIFEPTRDGYDFAGWVCEELGHTAEYAVSFGPGQTGDLHFTAKWAKRLTVTYMPGDADTGDPPTDSTTYSYYNQVTVQSNGSLDKIGYIFLGWSESEYSSSLDYYPYDTFFIEDDVLLYPVWQENDPVSFTVTYYADDADSGRVPEDYMTYQNGVNVNILGTDSFGTDKLSRVGYRFAGWAYNDGATTPDFAYQGADDYFLPAGFYIFADTNLYAVWEPDYTQTRDVGYTVKYTLDGAEFDADTLYKTKQVWINAPSDVTVTVDAIDAANDRYTGYRLENDPFVPPATVQDGDVIIVAYIRDSSAETYTITYHDDGADGGTAPPPETYEDNAVATMPDAGTLYKTGYSFLGWSPTQGGTDGHLSITIDGSDVDMYPVWSINYYNFEILYYFDHVPDDDLTERGSAPYGSIINTYTDPYKPDFVFDFDTGPLFITTTDDDNVLKVFYKSAPYYIYYVLDGGVNDGDNPGTYTVLSSTIMLKPAYKPGYAFMGWDPVDTIPAGSTGNRTFTAIWSDALEYNITYVLNGGANAPGNPSSYTIEDTPVVISDPTRDGYIFDGWEEGNTIPAGSTGDMTFTARWIEDTQTTEYTLSFNSNGGTSVPTQTVEDGEKATKPSDPTKIGYTFGGWYRNASLTGDPWDFDNDAVEDDTTLYAKWTPKTYTITFNANGGSGTMAPQTVTFGADATLIANSFSIEYGRFLGWATGASDEPIYDDEHTFSPWSISGNLTLYAAWAVTGPPPIAYEVTFETNGGTSVASQNVPENGKAAKPADPTKAGHDFGGWFKDAACTIPWDFDSDVVTEATTLYAKWTPKTNTITFDANGGAGGTAGKTVNEGSAAGISEVSKARALFK